MRFFSKKPKKEENYVIQDTEDESSEDQEETMPADDRFSMLPKGAPGRQSFVYLPTK